MMKRQFMFLLMIFCLSAGIRSQTYNYAEALQKSLYFYDAQKSGPGITGGRLPWRGNSEIVDTHLPLNTTMTNMSQAFIDANRAVLDPDGNGTVDVSGGFHDAGDHVKFGLPQTYSSSMLEWALYDFKDAFVNIGEYDHMMDILHWFSDYYLRSTFFNSSGDVVAFCYQVGEGSIDHTVWAPPEIIDTNVIIRPGYFATSETPASDQCAGAAASLALSYLNNQADDPTYAAKCLNAARKLYTFAVNNRGLGYSGGFYDSSHDEDELAWAAVWLYTATNDSTYLNDIISKDANGMYTGWLSAIIHSSSDNWQNIWVQSWDTKWAGVFARLAYITNDPFYWYIFRWNLEYWSGVPHQDPNDTNFLTKTPAGFSFLNSWGSARYNAAAQFTAMIYKKYANSDIFDAWTQSQMHYIMGNNPLNRSYIVGYGTNYAKHPHHRAAHGSATNDMNDPPNDKHILYGALVGGPDANDQHEDVTTNFVDNEVAIDYNAGLVGALAGLYTYYGQGMNPIPNFYPTDPPLKEYGIMAKIEQENNQRSQISIQIDCEPAYPPRLDVVMKARYYFSIAELMQYGQTISDVTYTTYYDESGVNGLPVQVSGPIAWDAANGIYYVEFTWPKGIYGKRAIQFGLIAQQDPVNYVSHWDPTNDYSHQDLTSDTLTVTNNIPLYADGVLVAGVEPTQGTVTAVTGVSVSPATLSLSPGSTGTLTATVTPSNASNKSVTWSTGNSSVATVSSGGVVTAVANGTTTITATTTDGGFTATSAVTVSSSTVAVTGVTITPASASLLSGGSTALTATVTPSNATNQSVTWSTSNSSVATVSSSGTVVAVGNGTATITATTVDGGFTASSVITVADISFTPCNNPVPIALPFTQDGVGDFCYVTTGDITSVNSWNTDSIIINGEDFTNVWGSIFPPKANGKYYIHYVATVPYAHLEIAGTGGVINNVAVTGVTVAPTSASVNVGGTTTFTATVSPSDATDQSVSWSSSNSNIATVSSSGVVTGVAPGSATITATTTDGGFTASGTVTVSNTTVAVTGVTVAPTSASVNVSGTTTLTATVSPVNATDKSVSWSSDNTSIATVSNSGVVTGVAVGSATITVTTTDGGFTATSLITVNTNTVSVTGVSVTPASASVDVNATTTLTATVTPSNATDKSVSWSSDNTSIATVSNSGVVTGVAAGNATITVTTTDGGFTASSAITVNNGTTVTCTNPVSITIPFSQDGQGEYCWVTSQSIAYINSWNLDLLEVNGVDYTNVWSNNLPAPINGNYYIHYVGTVDWAHFEAPATKSAESLNGDKGSMIAVYPVPFKNELYINIAGLKNVSRIELYNSMGQLVKSLDTSEITAPVVKLNVDQPGNMFVLRIYSDSEIISKTVVKQ